jgi:hypothetical protein
MGVDLNMDKYLVFRLERRIDSGHPVQGELVQSCFELVKEFDLEEDAVFWAKVQSKRQEVRVVVIKGSVFGVV